MKGKILFTSYDSIPNLDLTDYEIKLQIVRFTSKGIREGFAHIPHLSPSENLFKKTMYKWKKLKFTQEEKDKMFNGKTGTWFDLYEEEFIKETKSRADFKIGYERLKYYLDNGTNIVAICYCEDKNKCHRSIIAKMLIDEGYNVILN